MAAINKEIGLDDALRGIGGGTGMGGHLSDDEKLSATESGSGKSARNGRADEIEVVGKEL